MSALGTDLLPGLSSSNEHDERKFKSMFQMHMICNEAPILHEKVAVLMLSWDEKNDDLSTRDEVNRLGNVFRDMYKFDVEGYTITTDYDPAMQVNHHLSGFILRNSTWKDKVKTLLIIYYAGHGNLGEPGELFLDGWSVNPRELKDKRNSIPWHSVEQIIRSNGDDIFVIFDCCHAGALATDHRASNSYVFEYLAACRKDELTPCPGDDSFTSALIWALEGLQDEGKPFNSKTLLERVREAPELPRDQSPILFERLDITNEHIWINSLNRINFQPEDLKGVYPNMSDEFIDLRFYFNDRLNNEDAKIIAKILTDSVKRFPKKPRHVTLNKKSSLLEHFRWVTDAFLKIRDEKQKKLIESNMPVPTETLVGLPTEAETLLERHESASAISLKGYGNRLLIEYPSFRALSRTAAAESLLALSRSRELSYVSVFWTWPSLLVTIVTPVAAFLLYRYCCHSS